ncbi:MAG: RluA family pseudouridine synthase [Deltaproteobacteria bacterium]|nr:RluA family pseudouridine synthase [Deltaproteobacteria bacterium]
MVLNGGFAYREHVGKVDSGTTILDYLAARYGHSSRDLWRMRLEAGEVLLDGAPAGPYSILKQGHSLVWRRPPWEEPQAPLGWAVLYRDGHILAAAKPSGLPTLPGGGFLEHTLLSLVRKHYPEAVPVHRLGRGTSGIVLFARTKQARSTLCQAFRKREVDKSYRALVVGVIPDDAFVVSIPIGPVPHPWLGSVHAVNPLGKEAVTRVRVLSRQGGRSIVEAHIETGRPHQIRIHMAAAGYPLVGDPLYAVGGLPHPASTACPGDCGYLLHAQRLRLRHPSTGAFLEVQCAPPPLLRTEGGGGHDGPPTNRDHR